MPLDDNLKKWISEGVLTNPKLIKAMEEFKAGKLSQKQPALPLRTYENKPNTSPLQYIDDAPELPKGYKINNGTMKILGSALPLPSSVQGFMQDQSNPQLSQLDKIRNVLLRQGGVDPNYNPEGI